MMYVFYFCIAYGIMCIWETMRGGGYQYSGPKDTGTVISRVVFSPMNWLRDHGYFYIRDDFFGGLFLTPFFYIPYVIYNHFSWMYVPALGLGLALGGMRAWGKTMLQMQDIKYYWSSFIRGLDFVGLYFLPWAIHHNLTLIYVPIIKLLATAAVMPLIYHFCWKINPSDKMTRVAECVSGFMLGGLSII